ncbi:hypothetical protein J2125_000309 [Erwinia toletana]|uniref:Uncharacterized protein n=1 Tax=Winslowiella toletana TaxID=92490 RepID=A0ABS4P379_9GAMM|nr:hypothetical protein [Winslowiella toletana]MBP2167117.1 hypothetical protein [Winslowiella toletana]
MEKAVSGQLNVSGCLSAFPREGVSSSTIFSSLFCFQRPIQTDMHYPVRNTLWPLCALFSTAIQGLKGSHDL